MSVLHDSGFRISALRLRGYRKDYTISFKDEAAAIMPLAILAGEISTGKTTVLEFIDFCLGANKHPEHIEILQSVRSAQLEIFAFEPVQGAPTTKKTYSDAPSVGVDAARWAIEEVSYVIERSIEGSPKSAIVYKGTLDNFVGMPRKLSTDSGSEDNLSKFLLQLCGLDGIRLRQAPTKPDSATQALSFRDLSALWYLSNTRLDNGNLAREHQPHIAIKLRQVVDIIFDVHDETGAALANQINELRTELSSERAGVKALWGFLREQGVAGPIELETKESEVAQALRRARNEMRLLDEEATQRTSFAAALREEYLHKLQEAREAGARLRDRETLLRRLKPLKAQYAEDLKKLALLVEARRIFDPLRITVCPACFSELKSEPTITSGRCSLCRSSLPEETDEATPRTYSSIHTEEAELSSGRESIPSRPSTVLPTSLEPDLSSSLNGDHPESHAIDVTRELRSTQRRLNELKDYIDKVQYEVNQARRDTESADSAAASLQHQLDTVTRDAVTPLLAQRDTVARAISDAESMQAEVAQQRRMLASVEAKSEQVERLVGRLSEAIRRLRDIEESRRERDAVLLSLSARFSSILLEFGFPKLAGAEIDRKLIPHVRGLRYDRVGSSGAMTLLALAWELTLFELAYEYGGRHPGFLMIDSPQKNLAPEGRSSPVDEFSGPSAGAIVNNIYRHLLNWLSTEGVGAQVIVVDNVPPTLAAPYVIRDFTGDPSRPPYGLIDDATNV